MSLTSPKFYRQPLVISVLELLASTTSLAIDSAIIERKGLIDDIRSTTEIDRELDQLKIIYSQAQVLLTIAK